MATKTSMVALSALMVLLASTAAMPAGQQDADAAVTTTTTAAPSAANHHPMVEMADQAAVRVHDDEDVDVGYDVDDGEGGGRDADEDMRDRMAYLILSLWGEDLQGLDDAAAQEHEYRDPAEAPLLFPAPAAGRAERRKRDFVFRPLWATRERHARIEGLRQRYWNEYRRSQRFGRDVDAVVQAQQQQQSRTRRAAPMAEDALLAAGLTRRDAPVAYDAALAEVLSRVRRQWVNRPLFATRQRSAQQQTARTRRDAPVAEDALLAADLTRRDVPVTDDAALAEVLSRVRRQWVNRPLFATRQRSASRRLPYRFRRDAAEDAVDAATQDAVDAATQDAVDDAAEAVLTRRRREWTDVPLFAVKQIEAARVREDNEITHPHHREDERLRGEEERAEREYEREKERLAEYERQRHDYYRNYNAAYNGNYYNGYREYARAYRPYTGQYAPYSG